MLMASVVILLAGCLAKPLTVSGTLEPGLTSWQGEVRILGDVEIPADAQVVVAPGTAIVFLPPGEYDRLRDHPHFPGSELIIRGRFTAHGTAQQPIIFRFLDAGAQRGSWGGINIISAPRVSFAYCLFTQADSAIHSQESEVSIAESIFLANKVAIRFHSSNLLLEHNLIKDNDAGIRFHFGAPVIRNNLITGNGKGLFITSSPNDYLIRDNLFSNNSPYQVVLGEAVTEDVDLSGNWWQPASSLNLQESFFDQRRDPDLGAVVITPLLEIPPAKAGVSWSR